MHSRSNRYAAAAVAIALAAVGACNSRNESRSKEPPPAQPSPPTKATPPQPSGYAKARRVAIGPLARPIDPTVVFDAAGDWSKAPEPIKRLGRDARSGEVASLLVAGAAEAERDTAGAGADEWRSVGALVIAVVHEDAARGQLGDVVARLGAVAQLGGDIGDDVTIAAAAAACVAIALAHREDEALSKGCAVLAARAGAPK